MKRILLTAGLSLGLSSGLALADGKVYVTLPDMSGIARDAAQSDQLLTDLYAVMVLSQNCPGASLTGAEHSLVSDGFDLLAHGELKLSSDEVISRYEQPAFALLDDNSNCAREAQLKFDTLKTLEAAGGSLVPLPDQEKAYVEWRALMDSIEP